MLAQYSAASRSGHDSLPVCLCPWKENPYRLVSLWDMEVFYGQELHDAITLLQLVNLEWETKLPKGDIGMALLLRQERHLDSEERKGLEQSLSSIEQKLRRSGLPVSGEAVTELRGELLAWQLPGFIEYPAKKAAARIEEIQRTVRREMKTVVFLYLPIEKARWYSSPLHDWDEVIARWPAVKDDVEESSWCLAFDRFPGALFHALLVAEFGVIQICNFFGKSGDKPGWGCVERLQQIVDRPFREQSGVEKEHSKLLKDTVPEILALKADRHRLMHVDNKGDWLVREIGPKTATDAIASARKFMRRLATELPPMPQ